MKKALSLLIVLGMTLSMHTGVASENKSQTTSAQDKKQKYETVADILKSHDKFSMYLEAVEDALLLDALETGSDITVFVPTNAAFKEFPEETWDTLIDPINDALLENLVTYHMVRDRIMAEDIQSKWVETLYGNDVKMRSEKDLIMVGGARIQQKNLVAKNGVVHAIDTVLLPPAL